VRELKSRGTEKLRHRLADEEKELTLRQQVLIGLTTRAQLVVGAVSFASLWIIGTLFSGVVVGRLPFEPISWFAGMTRRTLEGDDLTEAGYLFFFALSNIAFRPFVTTLMGSERPKTSTEVPNLWSLATKLSGQQ
jgi:hypothetical protein